MLPIMASSYELPSTVSIASGSARVNVSAPSLSVAGITAWGPDWLRSIEIPAGAWEKSRPATGLPGGSTGSTIVWLPLELLLKAKVSPPPPPTSESSPAPPWRVSGPRAPIKVSSPVPPSRMALPEKPEASSVKSPVPAARIAFWKPLIWETEAGMLPPEVEKVVSVSVMFAEP